MKKLGKKLTLHKTTLEVLEGEALRNVKGGAVAANYCGLSSMVICTHRCGDEASVNEGN